VGTVSTISFKKDRPAPEVAANHAPPPTVNSPAPSASSPEPAMPAGPPISFEEALKLGLLNLDVEAPAEESAADIPASTLTPDSFAEALKRGLLDFGSG
jgi:enoyl-CoA hydratase/carnithine racemase